GDGSVQFGLFGVAPQVDKGGDQASPQQDDGHDQHDNGAGGHQRSSFLSGSIPVAFISWSGSMVWAIWSAFFQGTRETMKLKTMGPMATPHPARSKKSVE